MLVVGIHITDTFRHCVGRCEKHDRIDADGPSDHLSSMHCPAMDDYKQFTPKLGKSPVAVKQEVGSRGYLSASAGWFN
jgi:hypothetical protein